MDNKKQQQQARRKQEDAALNKLLIWFGAAIAYEAVALLLKRFYINFQGLEVEFALMLDKAFSVLWWLAPVLTVAAVAWLVMNKKNGKSLLAPVICAVVLFMLSFTSIACYFFFEAGVDVLGAVAPVAAVLALVYYLYQREFFCNTIFTGGGIFSLWMYRRFFMAHPNAIRAGFVLGWVLLAAVAVAAYRLSKEKGQWKGRQLFPPKTSYAPTYLTCAITAVTMLVALLTGATVAYYAMFALVIWLFCMAVYYTVRLM